MNPKLKQLYKDTLLRHSKQPANQGTQPEPAQEITLRNPLCGDEITIYLSLSGNQVNATFTAQCCAICTASASMMTETINGRSKDQAQGIAANFVSKFKDQPEALDLSGDLHALEGVHEFPSRIRCATLPWEAAHKLLG